MLFSLLSSRQLSIFSTIGCSSRIWASTRASVENPVFPRRLRVSPSFSKRIWPTCCGEPIVNSSSASSKISHSSVSIRSPKPAPDLGQPLGVELQPLPLHRGEDVDERQLDLTQQRRQLELLDAGPLGIGQGRDQPRLLGRVEAGLRLLAEGELALVGLASVGWPAPSARPMPASAASSVSS